MIKFILNDKLTNSVILLVVQAVFRSQLSSHFAGYLLDSSSLPPDSREIGYRPTWLTKYAFISLPNARLSSK